MQIFVKYAVNKSNGIVQLIDGKVSIPVDGWKGLTAREMEHPDVVDALRREWIEIKDVQPTTPENPPKKPLKVISAESSRGQEMNPVELDKVLQPKEEKGKKTKGK